MTSGGDDSLWQGVEDLYLRYRLSCKAVDKGSIDQAIAARLY